MCPLRPVHDGTETAVPEDWAGSLVEMQTIREHTNDLRSW